MQYFRGIAAIGPAPTAIIAGFFLLLATSFFWLSLQIGDIQRRRREQRKKQRME